LERKFLEWQIEMGERKSQADFAELIGVSRASLTMWMNGNHLPEIDNVHKLANVLGVEVYDALDLPRPNPYLHKINQIFDRLSPEHQQRLAEDAERYETTNHNTVKSPAKRKAPTDK
jgi:transcriptional regulator with XRE-family HTH domain